jgi:hypothetical protein
LHFCSYWGSNLPGIDDYTVENLTTFPEDSMFKSLAQEYRFPMMAGPLDELDQAIGRDECLR